MNPDMNFHVTGHPKATSIEDNIFVYLVVQHNGAGTVDVFRTVKGGCYELHRSFFDYEHFRQRMPNTAAALEREEDADRKHVKHKAGVED
jgi:hypothetical protein